MSNVFRFSSVKCSVVFLVSLMLPGFAWSEQTGESAMIESQSDFSLTADIKTLMLAHYSVWEGTRHKLGGSTSSGIDCSKFVQILFQDKFQLDLPRSSREQMTVGERVDQSELRSGDLLFFRTGPTRRHVGVYMGNNQFMHVSANAGVEIAKLHSTYWQNHFITARRVVLDMFTPSN